MALGTPDFKVQYGVRGLLMRTNAVGFEQLPSVKASLEAYNGVSSSREAIDPTRYLGFVRNVVEALRYVTEARNYKSILSTSGNVFSFGALTGAGGNVPIQLGGAGRPARNAAFAVGKDAQAIVTVVESSNQEEEAAQIVAVVGGAAAPGAVAGRQAERILNIIDMNIIPINVHALLRDIPLANLYNYEYTFEQMVAAIYGYTDADIDDMHTVNTRQMLLRLLVNPYLNIGDVKLYGSDVLDLGTAGFVHRIFRGDNSLGMGRPKFLSDQLFNKALFGSVYQLREDYDEAGPGVGAGIARGREGVGIAAAGITEGAPAQNRAAWAVRQAPGDRRSSTISFLSQPAAGTDPQNAVTMLDLSGGNMANGRTRRARLEAIGRLRFDTRLVRGLVHITNVLRLVRLKLNRELTQSRSVLVSSHSAVASSLTEYGVDPYGPNESLDSTFMGMPRFSDQDQPSQF